MPANDSTGVAYVQIGIMHWPGGMLVVPSPGNCPHSEQLGRALGDLAVKRHFGSDSPSCGQRKWLLPANHWLPEPAASQRHL